ncbi:MAG: Mov34/MPN/PAD-1 family protein [Planctomycetota bacterium]
MTSGIQFGDVEQAEPERGLRPDQDAHFATAEIGKISSEELLIFVDLDVMRDMEAHALSNTRVELGGVMLGRQLIDDQGKPFVIITDSLRAEHYEATKGSFKFTHETWSQITRQRDLFRPELEMVGWYHTHPGWSVFLSGMDLFICNNFFNRPLDVALVIDPCEQDRGWFQWVDDSQPRTQRTGGFILTTGRFRQLELDQFARIYNKEPMMNLDPRYSSVGLGNGPSQIIQGNQRNSVFEFGILGMVAMQFCLLLVIALNLLSSNDGENAAQIAKLESQVDAVVSQNDLTMREQAYREVLDSVVAQQSGKPGLVEKYAELSIQNQRMQVNLEGQLALAEKYAEDRANAEFRLKSSLENEDRLKSKLEETKSNLKASENQVKELSGESDLSAGIRLSWIWISLGSIAIAVLGAALGYSYGRTEKKDDYLPPTSPPHSNFDEAQQSHQADSEFPFVDDSIQVVAREPESGES